MKADPELVRLETLSDLARENIEGRLGNIHFKQTCNTPETRVTIDLNLIRRVIENFLSNACKYAAKSTEIELILKAGSDHWRCEVRDYGPGIAEADVPHIFDRFYQIKAAKHSTGLGLTFCKLAVDLHEGDIGVINHEEGCTFWFELPHHGRG